MTSLRLLHGVCAAISIAALLVSASESFACQQCATASSLTETLDAQNTAEGAISLAVALAASHRSETYGVDAQQLRFREWRVDLVTTVSAERWAAFLRLPWMARDLELESTGLELASVRRVGDLELGGSAELLPTRYLTKAYLSAQLGLSLPTGTQVEDSRGRPLPDETQPGTGSVMPFFGLLGGLRPAPYGVRGSALAYIPLPGRYDYQVGNSYQLSSDFVVEPTSWLQLSVGPHYLFNDAVRINGEREEDTGGGILFAAVGVDIALPQGFDIYSTARVSVFDHLYGTHEAPVIVDFGVRWRVDIRRTQSEPDELLIVQTPEPLL